MYTRRWSSDTPTDHASKLASVVRSSSDSARVELASFPDILNEAVYSLKLGIFRVPDA